MRPDCGSLVKTSPVHHQRLVNAFEVEKMGIQRHNIRLERPRSGSESKLLLTKSGTLLMEICIVQAFALPSQWKIYGTERPNVHHLA